MEELNISINSLANNKAPGIDIKIPTEVWKSGALNDQLLDVCKIMLEGGDWLGQQRKIVRCSEGLRHHSSNSLCIVSTYYNTEAKVCSPDGETNFFTLHAGVLQGDALAPALFIIALK